MVSEQIEYAIETVGLTKIFPDWWGRPKVKAVDDLNLRVSCHQIFGFLGPNGSGKTTTIKMLLGLLHPTRGRALVLGGSCDDPKIAQRIGYLPEESYLYRFLTARETLDFYGRLFGLPADVRKARIETLLEMVGLAGLGSRPVGTFSKGMARRIGLAQALINDPDLLILDEPTAGLDPLGTRQIKDLLVELARRGKTILLSSHLLADVEDICDRIAILYGGQLQVEGTVQELLEHQNEIVIKTGQLPQEILCQIRQIAESHRQPFSIERPKDKLETFFISVVQKARQQNIATSGATEGAGISGFLAQKPIVEPPSRLQELVERPVAASNQTQAVQAPPTAAPQAKKEVLEQLMRDQSSSAETAAPETPTAPKETVRNDILESLLERKQSSDGRTEPTRPAPDEPV